MNKQSPFFFNSLSLIKLIFFIDITGLLGSFRKIFSNFLNVTIDLKGVVGCNNIIASNPEFFARSINFFANLIELLWLMPISAIKKGF